VSTAHLGSHGQCLDEQERVMCLGLLPAGAITDEVSFVAVWWQFCGWCFGPGLHQKPPPRHPEGR
jgi:hypothetical protein